MDGDSGGTSDDDVIHSLLNSCLDTQSGGVVYTERKLLYARVTSMDSVDIGECYRGE